MIDYDIANATLKNVDIKNDFRGKTVNYTFPKEFNEVELFSLLLWKFKFPNGPMSMFIDSNGDPDAPFKWDYIFGFDSGEKIHILRSVSNLEVFINPKTTSKEVFFEFIENNLSAHREEVYKTLMNLENYVLLINPYKRHSRITDLAADELNKISYKTPVPPPQGSPKTLVTQYYDRYKVYLNIREKETLYSIMLVNESAFRVESYINMILAFFMKNKIKNDKDLFQETMRRGWKKKLQHLYLDCNYINENAEISKAQLIEMDKLFKMRNKIAHSYPDKKDLEVSKMWFWRNFPVLKNPIPFNVFQVGINNKLPTRDEALSLKTIADDAIISIDSFIEERMKNAFKITVNANPLGYNESKQLYSTPFSEAIIIGLNYG